MQLKPHQKNVVSYMLKSGARGIILYHGLGSGKTISSIAIAESFKDKQVVVIVPASMRTQWDKELHHFGVKMSRYDVMSYEGFLKKVTTSANFLASKIVIVDEAHRIRSATGKTATQAVKALQNAYKVILLTGTPMVNGPVDMSPLVNAVAGVNVLPTDEKKFKELFYIQKSKKSPPENKRCKLYAPATCSEDGLASKDGLCKYHYYMGLRRAPLKVRKEKKFKRDLAFEKKQKDRIERLRPALKEGVLKPNVSEYKKYVRCMVSYFMPDVRKDYPSVKRHHVKVKMSPEQNREYEKATKKVAKGDLHMMESGREVTRSGMAFNSFLNATRQISNTYKGRTDTPKLMEILKHVKKGPRPCIIYSNWLENGITAMGNLLDQHGISNVKFTGELSDIKKKEYVTQYNAGKVDVLLLSSSGGEGLDLKNTRQIHIMEPHWNIAKINQVIGRGIRYKSHEALPPSKRNVVVYYWISVPLQSGKKMGADEYLYQISEQKTEEIHEFLNTAIKGAIENENCIKVKMNPHIGGSWLYSA